MFRTTLLAAALALAGAATPAFAALTAREAPPTVILVHGAFADGSSWSRVIKALRAWHVPAVAVQNPLSSLADDVAATRRAIAAAPGKVVLVGHSWGGTVITEAGNDPKVQALVYVAAFAPDAGQTSAQQGEGFPVGPGLQQLQDRDGYLSLPAAAFAEDFAPDVRRKVADVLYATQAPLKASALGEAVTTAAWHTRPSWYVVSRDDRMLSPQLQMATARRIGAQVQTLGASHVSLLSHPAQVADSILEAAGVKPAELPLAEQPG
ncbi:alpha/beta hydrolase [Stenotrophomonas sp. 24(2023)]|uniref:alpha/beta fold hydrolase n=1 Tax=Stenotrophomonas sp. 24(2023) TaxID=3068324 RepID=UPI0027DFBA84|nr:alpha/beta hydrolase [Stenotrophomonas sp. 24(2023)]WMJ68259.1 alpha/beta hydrolase [Stenotrophomonas sp. 24(2023)]